MKPSGTNANFAITGIGDRLDPQAPEHFLAKVTAVTTSGPTNVYTLTEVEPSNSGTGYITKQGGFVVTTGYEINNATVPVNTIVNARFRSWSNGGDTYEFQCPAVAPASSGNQVKFCYESELPGGPLFTLGSDNNGSTNGQPGVIVPVGYIVRGIFTVNWTVLGSPSNKFIWDSSWGVSWQNSGSLLTFQQGGVVTQFGSLVPWAVKDPAVSGERYIMSFSCQIGFYGQSTSPSPDQVLLGVNYGPSFGPNNSMIVTSKSAIFTLVPQGGTAAPTGNSISV